MDRLSTEKRFGTVSTALSEVVVSGFHCIENCLGVSVQSQGKLGEKTKSGNSNFLLSSHPLQPYNDDFFGSVPSM